MLTRRARTRLPVRLENAAPKSCSQSASTVTFGTVPFMPPAAAAGRLAADAPATPIRARAPSRFDLIDNEVAEELWTASLESEVWSCSLIRDGRGLERGDDQL